MCARVVSRSCGRNPSVLVETMSLTRAACNLQPDTLETSLELAYQHYLCGEYTAAGNLFRDLASAHPESSVLPIVGLTLVQLRQLPLSQVSDTVLKFRYLIY